MKMKETRVNYVSGSDKNDMVAWSTTYCTGVALIDEQHKELVNLTNKLYQACLGGEEEVGPVFQDAMSKLVEYVRFHFSAELELLAKINYPDYQDHKRQHDALVKDILEAVKDFSGGKRFVANHFVRTLKDWVFSHIAIYDKRYAAFVEEQKKKGLLSDEQINS